MGSLPGVLAHALPGAEHLHRVSIRVYVILLHDLMARTHHAFLDALVVGLGLPLHEAPVLRHLLLTELFL